MATTAKIAKDVKLEKARKAKTPNFSAATGTAAGVVEGPARSCASSEFCRLCFRKLALNGEIPGVTKASW